MQTIQTQIRLDPKIKADANNLFKELGLDMSTAVNIFLRQCLIHGGLPFQVNKKKKLKKLLKSIDEAENLLNDPKAKTYETIEDLVRDLEKHA